jgi:hypothetical protein
MDTRTVKPVEARINVPGELDVYAKSNACKCQQGLLVRIKTIPVPVDWNNDTPGLLEYYILKNC